MHIYIYTCLKYIFLIYNVHVSVIELSERPMEIEIKRIYIYIYIYIYVCMYVFYIILYYIIFYFNIL